MFAHPHRTLTLLALTAIVAGVTTGCVPEPAPEPSPSAATSSPSATPTPTPTAAEPTPTATPTPTAAPVKHTPFSKKCDSVITPQQVYDFNPNFSLIDSFSPAGGSTVALAKSYSGTVCGWVNQTSGDQLSAGIAKPAASTLADLKKSAAKLPKASAFPGYFSGDDDSAVAQAFVGDFWVTVEFRGGAAEDELASVINAAIAAAK